MTNTKLHNGRWGRRFREAADGPVIMRNYATMPTAELARYVWLRLTYCIKGPLTFAVGITKKHQPYDTRNPYFVFIADKNLVFIANENLVFVTNENLVSV